MRRPQHGERVEHQVLRIGPDSEQPCATDEEIRAILGKDPRASGTVHGTHYAIRFHHQQRVSTPLVLADAPGDTDQAELPEHYPFASRSTVTSTATLLPQGQAVCTAKRNSLGQRVA